MLLLPFSIIAQERTKALKMLDQRGEIYVKFSQPSANKLEHLNKIISIDRGVRNKSANEIYAYVSTWEFDSFSKEITDFKVLTPPSMLKAASMCADLASVSNWNCYPTYPQYLQKMQEFETNYPNLCKVVEFGQSVEGRKLHCLQLKFQIM